MSKNRKLSPLATAVGVSIVTSLASLPVTHAAGNPFAAKDLGSGYTQVAEGNCGGKKEMKAGHCGGKKDMKDGHCGGKKGKKDGKCGEGKCGEGKKMKKEGKCGGAKK